jgi:hypothetical protein
MGHSTPSLYGRRQVAEEIEEIVRRAQSAFLEQRTKPITFRLEQLRKLWWGYVLYTLKKRLVFFHRGILCLVPRPSQTAHLVPQQTKISSADFRITRTRLLKLAVTIWERALSRLWLVRFDGAKGTSCLCARTLRCGWRMKRFQVRRRSTTFNRGSGRSP